MINKESDDPRPLERETVSHVLSSFWHHPISFLILRWNWKSALFSSLIRASIFFATNIVAGFRAAVTAMLTEFTYRALMSGFYGGLTQSFRRVEPPWQALLATVIMMPLISHTIEFTVHYFAGTKKLLTSIAMSVVFTIISTSFNLFAMRRGVMIVGESRQSLLADLRQLPGVIAGFVLVVPRAIRKALRKKSLELKETVTVILPSENSLNCEEACRD